ncbi:hypothetical protein [Streptomyces sp. APSN-46.1]|uniref:hypothetical protein n=1 Tax=Streptomyces sp. APSN-46.1 TaxID=2929049 RepID=UPI0024372234|nr:hypothetical protein [Streptomyces sp. APSN-46.1]
MSTPEEQNQQQQNHQQHPQDPYGTQTWQSETWDTSYQPVHPPLGGVPGQPVAPEGWFRDEAPPVPQQPAQPEWPEAAPWPQGAGAAAGAAEQTAYLPPVQQPQPQQQPQQSVAPDSWFREEAPQAPQQPVAPSEWSQAGAWPQGEAVAETAYLPPVQQQPQQQPQAVAPDSWFREEAAQQPVAPSEWSQAGAWPQGEAVAETAYLPPVREAAAEQTAYLPPQAAAPVEPVAPAEPLAPGAEPEYSPPTLAGNTLRAVDPAQARAEGRSPIIDPGPQSALLTAALGILLAVAAALGQYALLLPLIALQGLTAAGWFRLNGMWPARQGIALAFLGALVADAAVLAVDRTYGPGAIIGTLGAWVLLTLVLQLRSHADPDERMYGLMASVAAAALAIVCAGYLAAGSDAVTIGGVAVAAAVFARALPLPTAPSVGVSLASAAGAGIAVGGLTVGAGGGALLGLVAGVCALIGLRVAAYDYPSKFVHMTAGVALPLAVAAPAVYLIGRVVG